MIESRSKSRSSTQPDIPIDSALAQRILNPTTSESPSYLVHNQCINTRRRTECRRVRPERRLEHTRRGGGNASRPTIHAVTIDFHDTLFTCDEWFELEVRELPVRFLEWFTHRSGEPSIDVDPVEINKRYRALRMEAIESGIEVDSIDGVERLCREFSLNVSKEEVQLGVDALMRSTLGSVTPKPGAVELVRALSRTGVKMGVISNAIHHPFLEWALERFQLDSDFDMILSSASSGYYKSRVELYQHASDLLSVPAQQTVHIGDSHRFDVVGASRAGMRTVWLNLSGDQEKSRIADITVDSLVGLASTLMTNYQLSARPQAGATRAV